LAGRPRRTRSKKEEKMSRKRVKKTKKTAGEENPIFKPPDSPHFQIGAQTSHGSFGKRRY
jgi:hypothetical protein